MLIEQQPAFVLHARAYRETSLLLECLTRDHGRLGVVARGVRKERARLQRAHLEPFRGLRMDLQQRGELATLRGAEADGNWPRLLGDALLCGLYVNELTVRLCERQDLQAGLFDAYARTLRRLAGDPAQGWTLRRFERDLLQALGYALQLRFDAQGEPLRPEGVYLYHAEDGPHACGIEVAGAVLGDDLLGLDADRAPDAGGQRRLRRMMREVLRFHLGGRELRAWRVLRGAAARG